MNDPDFNLLAALDPLPVSTASGAGPGHRWLRQRVREVCRE